MRKGEQEKTKFSQLLSSKTAKHDKIQHFSSTWNTLFSLKKRYKILLINWFNELNCCRKFCFLKLRQISILICSLQEKWKNHQNVYWKFHENFSSIIIEQSINHWNINFSLSKFDNFIDSSKTFWYGLIKSNDIYWRSIEK